MAHSARHLGSLEGEGCSNANLFIVKLKCLEGAVILAVEIIRTYRPKSSNCDVCGRLDVVIVIVSIGSDAIDGAEIIVVLVTDGEAQIDPLEQALIHGKVNSRLNIILSDQN